MMLSKMIVGAAAVACLSLPSCVIGFKIVRPGEVGFKQILGKLKEKELNQGLHVISPLFTRVIRINTRTVEIFQTLPLPTKEGLNVQADIILLYHVRPDAAQKVYTQYGVNYEKVIVESNFLATARDVSAKYLAKELYAIERAKVEDVMKTELSEHIQKFGFEVDAVLLKDIILPPAMVEAVQAKVNAEQANLQMDFVIARQLKEAERLRIEAEGIRRSQQIIDSSLTDKLLRYNEIQMMKSLINSPNSKVIITDGKVAPLMSVGDK